MVNIMFSNVVDVIFVYLSLGPQAILVIGAFLIRFGVFVAIVLSGANLSVA